MVKTNNTKKGFTIIEVTLVLAIAGLIFMMVFLALPALQRAQRDTQRSDDMARVSTALNNFQANNRGAIPGSSAIGDNNAASVTGSATKVKGADDKAPGRGTWGYFYNEYLLVGSAGQTDTFADPDGEPYSLWVQPCKSSDEAADPIKIGDDCNNAEVQVYAITFDDQSTGGVKRGQAETKETKGTGFNLNSLVASLDINNLIAEEDVKEAAGDTSNKDTAPSHSVTIALQATCQGEAAVYSSGKRKVAILYKKEGGGVICVNN